MGQAEVDITIKRSPDDVWAVIGDFGALDKWLPGVESCRVEGEERQIQVLVRPSQLTRVDLSRLDGRAAPEVPAEPGESLPDARH